MAFAASAYILKLHPMILSEAGLPFGACVTSTVLICFFSSLMMSLYAKNPFLLAPALGINSFFALTLILEMKVPISEALGLVFWSGLLFLILSCLNLREILMKAVPDSLKLALTVGIGLFIFRLGVGQGFRNFLSYDSLIFVMTAALASLLLFKKIRGAFLISMIVSAFLSFFLIGPNWPEKIFSQPDFSLILKMDLLGALRPSLLPALFTLAFVDLFESMGTFTALLNNFKIFDKKGRPRHLKKCLITDASATMIAGALGSSPATTYLESAAGIKEGGRTGLAALTSAFLFLPFLFFAPLITLIPKASGASVLAVVGALMTFPAAKIDWKKWESALPALCVMILIPLTFSISKGFIAGILSLFLMKKIKRQKIPQALCWMSVMALLFLFIELYFF